MRTKSAQATSAPAGRGRFGGGLLLLSASPTLRNLIVQDNRAEIGGGMYALQGAPHVENCRFFKNEAGQGAGADLEMTNGAVIDSCKFGFNLGVTGGGITLLQGSATIEDCRFESNQASEGGAMNLLDCANATVVRRSIFWRNRGADGAVALVFDSDLRFEACTAAANGYPEEEPASLVYRGGSSGSITRMIIAAERDCRPLLVEDSDVEVTCSDLWPDVEPSDSPGGANLTGWPGFCDLEAGDLTLRDDSPCLAEHAPTGCGQIGALSEGCSGTGPGGGRSE